MTDGGEEHFHPDKFPGVIERIEITDKHVAKIEVPSRYAEGLRAAKEHGGVYVFLCYPLSSPEQVASAMDAEDFGALVLSSNPQTETPQSYHATLDQLANALDCSEKTVQNYVDAGHLVRNARGQYDLISSLAAMNKARKESVSGQNDSYHDERTKAIRLKRMERELGYHERAGNLVNAAAVRSVIEKAKAAEKQQVLFMPKQLAPRLEGDPAVNEAVLEEWAYSFLKGQTEINITADVAPAPDVDKMPALSKSKGPKMKKQKKRKKKMKDSPGFNHAGAGSQAGMTAKS